VTGTRLRILQVHCRYRELGGEDTVADDEAAALSDAGHQVYRHLVANPEGSAASVAGLVLAPYNPGAAASMSRIVGDLRPSVAHVHNTWYSLSPSVLRALHRSGTPVVVTLHNYRTTCANGLLFRDGHPCERCIGGSVLNGVALRCYHGSAVASAAVVATMGLHRKLGTWSRHVDALVVPSAFARDRLVAAGLPEGSMHVLPHAVPDAGGRPAPPSESRSVLYVGRVTAEKGVADLVQAWLQAAPPGLELKIIGDGPLREALAGAGYPRISFLGHQPPAQVRAEMLAARALVLPSRWYETFGRVAAEAFSAGLPVLASDIGAVAELVRPALGDPWLVSPTASGAWTEPLRRLADGAAVDAGGAAARSRFDDDLSQAAGLARLEGLYRAVG
jgi:glycosyltransferase involved in cell wall biosynthesis